MKSECLTWAFRFYMICLINGMMYTANGFILRGGFTQDYERKNIPLFALESQEPVKNFDFLGITIQYEMCYTNILQILDLSQIAMLSSERKEDDPIVIGGGPCSYNPEPIADFFDLFYIGEGEISYTELFTLYKQCRKEKVPAERNSYAVQRLFLESMCLPCMRWLIKKMERLHPLHQNMRRCRQR